MIMLAAVIPRMVSSELQTLASLLAIIVYAILMLVRKEWRVEQVNRYAKLQ